MRYTKFTDYKFLYNNFTRFYWHKKFNNFIENLTFLISGKSYLPIEELLGLNLNRYIDKVFNKNLYYKLEQFQK